MKETTLIILLIFFLIFQLFDVFKIYNVYFAKHNLSKPIKCDVDKRIEFMEKCINKIDFIYEPEQVDATGIIRQCEETSQNLHCTY
jgi:hypothetical protein